MKICFVAAGLTAFVAPYAHAHTIAVGTCVAGANRATSITDAIAAVGVNGVVKICPGTYAEQLTITKNVQLEAVATSASSQVILVPPASGLTSNAPDLDGGGATAAQIAVQNANVSISGITVDGAGNTVGNNGCAWDIVGIIYQNASGKLTNNLVRNQFLTPFSGGEGLGGCQAGLGIYVQSGSGGSSNVVISNNTVETYQKNGITGNDTGTNVTITGNTVLGMGPTSGAAENSIQIAYGATGSVKSNILGDDVWAPDQFGDTGDAAAGVLIYASPNVPIIGNMVSSTQTGIFVGGDNNGDGDGATISGNTVGVTYFYDGIDVCGAGSATITKNAVNASDESGIHVDGTCGSGSPADTITGSKINGGCAGILLGAGVAAPTTSNNSILNATNITLSGDVCQGNTGGMEARQGRHAARHPKPFR